MTMAMPVVVVAVVRARVALPGWDDFLVVVVVGRGPGVEAHVCGEFLPAPSYG